MSNTLNNELLMIDNLLSSLPDEWFSSFYNYNKLNRDLHSISKSKPYLDVLLKHAKRSKKYDTPYHIDLNIKIWNEYTHSNVMDMFLGVEGFKKWIENEILKQLKDVPKQQKDVPKPQQDYNYTSLMEKFSYAECDEDSDDEDFVPHPYYKHIKVFKVTNNIPLSRLKHNIYKNISKNNTYYRVEQFENPPGGFLVDNDTYEVYRLRIEDLTANEDVFRDAKKLTYKSFAYIQTKYDGQYLKITT